MSAGKLRFCSVGKLHFGMGESMMKPALALVTGRIRSSVKRFNHDERGAMAFIILFFFIMMLMFGGIAVDVMRFETRRVAMQQTMDRAALAAANLNNAVTATAVVNDYFAKADLGAGLNMVNFTAPTVTTSGNGVTSKKVEVSSRVRSNNFFMHLLNVDYLEGPAATTAEQGVAQIEVILVLDVSGSMNDNGKIAALRTSATNFVNKIKDLDALNQVSVGIVPYNAQVNLGPLLRGQFNATHIPVENGNVLSPVTNVNCLQLPSTIFDSTAIPTTLALPMVSYADTNSDSDDVGAAAWNSVDYGTHILNSSNPCNPTTRRTVLMPTKTRAPILNHISNLTAGGNTSIFLGMRWGVALIDESARPIYTAIADVSVAGRPADNTDQRTRKIIILMTDGDHVSTNIVPDAYKVGLSPVYRSSGDGNFSTRFTAGRPACAGTNEYWVPHLWASTPRRNTIGALNQPCGGAWQATAWNGGSGTPVAVQQDWSQLWRVVRQKWVARQLFGRAGVTGVTYSDTLSAIRVTNMSDTAMDSLLSTNCGRARLAGIEVYGIAFTAPPQGTAAISDCASSPKSSYFFDATDNAGLDAAFQMIASKVSELRLTQ